MSRKILDNGWNIGCLLPMYENVDFTLEIKNNNSKNMYLYDDVMYPQYCNKIWTPNQLIFVKGNRVSFSLH